MPVAVRLPILAAVLIFIAAISSTQTALFFMGRQVDRQVERLGSAYLDGLSTALLPSSSSGDDAEIRATLDRALSFSEGVVDRHLAYLDAGTATVTEARRSGIDGEDRLPSQVVAGSSGFLRSGDGSIWIWRPLAAGADTYGTIVANLDVSSADDERWLIRWLLLLYDLMFSGACAVIGFFMVRRIQRPIATVARHLYDAALGMVRPITSDEIPAGDRQAERMMLAFNAMVSASGEREKLLGHLADQQREADLGRLTATIAHEVRNPLGGMRTAISTLKRFGDREEPRREAVDFLERGVAALHHVVNATLENYRARPDWRPLSRQDFEDLRLLVAADGRSRDVSVTMDIAMPETVAVAALDVRQVVLNLLLNAVRASSKGGRVALEAAIRNRELVVSVRDEGRGLDRGLARALEDGTTVPDGPGLGVAVVIRLVERLQGRVAIESSPGSGTGITLHIPLQNRSPAS